MFKHFFFFLCSGGSLVVVVCSFKCLRSAFCDSARHYLVLIFMTLFFNYDFHGFKEPFLINFFIFTIFFSKVSILFLYIFFCLKKKSFIINVNLFWKIYCYIRFLYNKWFYQLNKYVSKFSIIGDNVLLYIEY